VIHYAVERSDPELIEIFKTHMHEQSLTALVNQADHNGRRPIEDLQKHNDDNPLQSSLGLTLLCCGAQQNSE